MIFDRQQADRLVERLGVTPPAGVILAEAIRLIAEHRLDEAKARQR